MAQMKELSKAIADLDEPKVLKLVEQFLAGKPSEADISQAVKACQEGMSVVGKRYEAKEYFLPELIFSGEILREVMSRMLPRLKVAPTKVGKVVMGTVAGDIHDIGKNIVVFMLDVNGFEVYDLGVDVPAQKFVEKVKETGAPVVGLSGLLTLAYDSMKQTIDAIKTAGLREKVKIMIGGAQVTDKIREYAGADAWGEDAMAGVSLAKKWVGGK